MSRRRQMGGRGERGVALITAMLVVSLVTVAAASMAMRTHFDIRRTGNLFLLDQGYLYTRGFEGFAGVLMGRYYDEAKPVTAAEIDQLNAGMIPFDTGSGVITARFYDLQARFNLNTLVKDGEVDEVAKAQFIRLLKSLKLEESIATAVVDWLDVDQEAGFPGGAEDGVYMGREKPYRSADGIMGDLSELLLVEGVDWEVFEALEPYVTVLPVEGKLNINTATAKLLMSLGDGITDSVASTLIEKRDELEGFGSVDEFLKDDALAGEVGAAIDKERLTTESEYFLIATEVAFEQVTLDYLSVLKRDKEGAARVVARARGSMNDAKTDSSPAGE